MMTLELNDLSFFLKSFHSPTPNFNIMDFISFRSGSTRSSSLRKMHIPFNPSNRSHHFYFSRLPHLWNSLPLPTLDPFSAVSSNFLLIKNTFMDKFMSTFDPSQPCTSHFYCPCGKCFISPPAFPLTSRWHYFYFLGLLVNWASCLSVNASISLLSSFHALLCLLYWFTVL